MSSAHYCVGDSLDLVRKLPDESIDLVFTSPPFLALRSYLPDDDPAKVHEIGQEATPGAFLDVLLDLTEELARVLAPHGTLAVELGDTYSGSGGAGGDYADGGMREGQPRFRARNDGGQYGNYPQGGTKHNLDVRPITGGAGWPEAKSLCLIPELYRIALVYGRNPLTGRETPRWRARNVVRWVRPNPPVGALGDKFRPATSDLLIVCKARDRYFDLDAVREELKHPEAVGDARGRTGMVAGKPRQPLSGGSNPAGAPPNDWWKISTEPYPGSHYATFPRELVVRPVKAMSPERVCRVCGQPSRRITETTTTDAKGRPITEQYAATGQPQRTMRGKYEHLLSDKPTPSFRTSVDTLGWSCCGCCTDGTPGTIGETCNGDHWRPGRVLDPFAGSGTTLAVATGHGRDAVGFDLDKRNVDLARDRVGPMFFHHVTIEELVLAGVSS